MGKANWNMRSSSSAGNIVASVMMTPDEPLTQTTHFNQLIGHALHFLIFHTITFRSILNIPRSYRCFYTECRPTRVLLYALSFYPVVHVSICLGEAVRALTFWCGLRINLS